MSLGQRARKKFFGSLGKRKKLKITEDEDDKPPPLPRSRPPLPSFTTKTDATYEPTFYLQTSMSLPDQLDEVGTLGFPTLSFKPLNNFQLAHSTFGRTHEDGVSHCSLSLDSLKLPPDTISISAGSKFSSSRNTEKICVSLEDPGCEATAEFGNQGSHVLLDSIAVSEGFEDNSKLQSVENCGIKDTVTMDSNSTEIHIWSNPVLRDACKSELYKHTKPLALNSSINEFQTQINSPRSRRSASLTDVTPEHIDSDTFVNSLFSDIINTYNVCSISKEDEAAEGELSLSGELVLTENTNMPEDVFEPAQTDMPSCDHKLEISSNNSVCSGTAALPVNNYDGTDMTLSNINNDSSKVKHLKHQNFDNVYEMDIQPPNNLPSVQRKNSTVMKRIRFFEGQSGNNANCGPQVKDKKRSASFSSVHKKPFINLLDKRHGSDVKETKKVFLWTRSTSVSEENEELAQTRKTKKPAPIYRMFRTPTLSSPRLNFTQFRNSDCIPEVVAECVCGLHCDEECISGCSCTNAPGGVGFGEGGSGIVCSKMRNKRITPSQICHHPQCTDDNEARPFMLCRQCDTDIHKHPEYSGHLVLDRKIKKGQVPARPPSPSVDYDDGSDSDSQQDRVDGLFVKHNSQTRMKPASSELERKLKRKKGLIKKKGKNDLDAALDQIADPEGYETVDYYKIDADSNDQRITVEIYGRRDSGLEDTLPGTFKQDSLESPTETVVSSDSYIVTSRVPVRRQSRVSDSHFTLKFGVDGRKDDLEVVAALQNTTLREAIEGALSRRNIDVNSVNVFIEKSRTPLPMSSETVFLAGNVLEIKEKDDKDVEPPNQGKTRPSSNKNTSSKGNKQSGGSLRGRTRSGNLSVDDTFYPSTSPSGSWSESKRGKSPKLSVVNLFTPANKDKEKQDQLTEILNRYSLHGLPPLPDLLALGRPKFDDSLFELESNWKKIASNHQDMTKKQQEQQEAVWELLLTEVSYIKQIRVIIDVFQNCLINVQQESFLNEIETERLFSNIDKVFECNCLFWQQYLLPVLKQGRECRRPLEPLLAKEGFVDHFPILFQVYFKYFIEHKSCLEYAKSHMESNELFKIFIQWAETQKLCNRLKLADILVKPMQRLLKYSLLLQAILRHTENTKDRADIQEMIQSVDKLCWAANNSLRRREDYEKLEAVRKTIEPYDAIEAPNDECAKIIQEYNGKFNLLASMPGFKDGPRSLVFHSSLRMREAQNAKLDVDCLLFTDLILICKPNKRMERFKIIRPPMRLDQIVVSELKDKGSFLLIYVNEYHVPISAFTFHSDTGAIRGWLEKFREAQRDFKIMKLQESVELEQLRMSTSGSQVDVENTSVPNIPTYLDLVSSSFPRSDSMESTDRFLPNLLTPSDSAGDASQLDLAHSDSAVEFHNHTGHRELPHANTEPRLLGASTPDFSPSDKYSTSGNSYEGICQSVLSKHKPVQTSRSVPNIMVGSNNGGNSLGASPPSGNGKVLENSQGFQEVAADSSYLSYSPASDQPENVVHSTSHGSISEQNSISEEEELARLKLNSRRVSRSEKRYHTADAIQDMKISAKDSSIHKRLSWRTDVQVMEHKNMGSKVQSTDSVRSIPSSSGVSSTGSLHLTMENEISEEHEGNGNDSDNVRGSIHGRTENCKLFLLGDAEDMDDETSDDYGTLSDSKQSKSKSTSDLVIMFNNSLQVSEMEGGIASVAVSSDGYNRKLTHADILKMKKLKHQILHDANIESSEV